MNEDNWKHKSLSMTCTTCMWFVEKAKIGNDVTTKALGRCRRHSPTLGGWPALWSNDWCGDHKIDEEKI